MDRPAGSAPSSRQPSWSLSSSPNASRAQISPAMLMDPKAMKKQMKNGSLPPSPHSPSFVPARGVSEPLVTSSPSLLAPLVSELPISSHHAYSSPSSEGGRVPAPHPTASPATNGFDPRRLLDPKGFDKSARHDEGAKSTPDSENLDTPYAQPQQRNHKGYSAAKASVAEAAQDEYEGKGMTSLIEKAYNVSHREERPQKRQKVETNEEFEEEAKPKAGSAGRSGGDLGEYMKQKKKEGLAESHKTPAITIDLTEGGDEEISVVSDSQLKEVCYGRLDGAKVQAHAIPFPTGKSVFNHNSGIWPTMKLSLARHPGKDNIIRVLDPAGKDFGNVDIRTSLGLARIMDCKNPRFRVQARLNMRKRSPTEYPGKEVSEYYDMTINLYGPRKNATAVGRHLSQKQIYLRTPISSDANIDVFNPQAPTQVAPRTSLSTGYSTHGSSGAGYVTRTVEEVRSDVIGMFDSLQKSENLPEMSSDPRIKTELLSHQKQGLYFLTNKEKHRVFSDKEEDNNSLWRLKFRPNGSRAYYNVITGKEEVNKPPEVLGGILADMMGLGKTLSILALIVGSMEEAKAFSQETPPATDGDKPLRRNAKTTLLVTPLSTVQNWEEQIATHIRPKTLNYYAYHGNRTSDIDELAKYDVVVTTYQIVASEFSGRGIGKNGQSPLQLTNFFRIVLDEAHMIREQSTQQSKAICALSAQRRWAVTGTPVQNRLDDLGALIKFLRVYPFNEANGFAQFILAPFKNADPEILPKLRLLVDSFTLRRLKDRIDLPPRHDQIVRLEFSEEEAKLYDWFSKDSQNRLKLIVSDQKKSLGGKTYAHILRAIMRLRLLCAHGRELLSEDDLKIAEGFSADNAIDLESEDDDGTPALSPRQAYEMLMLLRETASDTCFQCTRTVKSKDEDSEEDEILGCMLPCYQILCRECMPAVQASIEQAAGLTNKFKCPSCSTLVPKSFFELTRYGIDKAEEDRAIARENPRQAKIMGRYGGPHTKVRALIEELKKSQEESKSLPGNQQPIKSVVFSGWTANLDLIQIALEDNGITYRRLDGKMGRRQRAASLDAFRDDPSVCVILISIMAGGLGLNLTSGSKVFVMEPQFNPAAEAQAIDRVHRLGQTREVFTYRYIMGGSFEEKMLDLQRKKQNLADLSMNRGKMDKGEAVRRKLDELRSLFK